MNSYEESVVISAKNLSLSYRDNEIIIDNATFQIKKGQFVFITGPSGSGKSTLLKSFYGDIKNKQGELTVTNSLLSTISDSQLMTLRKHIGIVFQDYKLIKEWNIEKNVMLPLLIAGYSKRVCDAQVDKLLAHVDLDHRKGRFPMELSGGEQQRVAMARALAHNPVLILADEPTGNLDSYSSDLIWQLLAGANTQLKTTIIVVTHDIPPVMNLNYVHYSIQDGRVINQTDRYGKA